MLGKYWLAPGLAVLSILPAYGRTNSPSTEKLAVFSLPSDATAPVKFGAESIRQALIAKGFRLQNGSRGSTADLAVIVSTSRHPEDRAESYSISLSADKQTILVQGTDPTGAMYGELDLAEQVGMISGGDLQTEIKPVKKSPYLQVRGVNMFLTVQDIDNPDGAFWSDEYWNIYFDTMAQDRYNLLDIHGPCDPVTLTFPNGFAYFVSLPDFPQIGVGPERATRNLARLRQVIQMAADRGIKVAYMNYEATAPIGPWKTRKFGVDERWVDLPQPFMTGPQVETYTREAVVSLLKQLPDLWMFGFRVGESGQPEDFYKHTYVPALAQLPSTLKVYLRTWIADPEKVRDLASSLKNPPIH